MVELGKGLIFIGCILLISGLCVIIFSKMTGLGNLPGDILIKKNNFSLYVPVTTCILLSLILSFIFIIFGKR